MTREEAIKELKEYEDGLDLEYATPFDKAIMYAIKALEQEPTTKNNLGVDKLTIIDWNNCHTSEQLDSIVTTKNNLGVDCISRQIISDYVESHIQEINTGYGDLNRHTNSILRMIVDYVENMPSVTPQEPTDKNFTKADIDAIVKAINAHWELIIDEIRTEITNYEGDCQLSVDEYPSCKQCTDNVFKTIYGILDKYKAETEDV